MSNLSRRIDKLEKMLMPEKRINIVCTYVNDDNATQLKADALDKYEAENGPLGDIEPVFVVIATGVPRAGEL